MAGPEVPPRVGFVGLGRMGGPMAARLLDAGAALRVFDLRREAVADFVTRHGGTPAASLAELGRASDVVVTMLPDGGVVGRAVLGASPDEDRLLGALGPGAVLVDMSSSDPTGTRALGAELAVHGIAMLDAPVSGGVRRAVEGRLTVMVGGDPAVADACRTLFAPLAARVFRVGPLGAGHALKALNNLVSAAGVVATAEALLVGRRFGLDPNVMLEVLNASTARNNASEHKFRQFVFSRSFASGFALDLMAKDLGTALDLARVTGTPAPVGAEVRALFARARDALGAGADHTEVVRFLEQLAGATLATEPS